VRTQDDAYTVPSLTGGQNILCRERIAEGATRDAIAIARHASLSVTVTIVPDRFATTGGRGIGDVEQADVFEPHVALPAMPDAKRPRIARGRIGAPVDDRIADDGVLGKTIGVAVVTLEDVPDVVDRDVAQLLIALRVVDGPGSHVEPGELLGDIVR